MTVVEMLPEPRTAIEERFWSKVRSDDSGCWLWTGHTRRGYGGFRDGREVAAHRWAYERCVGPIPDGLQLDHLCRTRACVRPAHMEPVTARENILRGAGLAAQRARATHCPKGHEYTAANTYARNRHRYCKRCHNELRVEARKRAAADRVRGRLESPPTRETGQWLSLGT